METKALMIGAIIFGAILLIGLVALNAVIPDEIFAIPQDTRISESSMEEAGEDDIYKAENLRVV